MIDNRNNYILIKDVICQYFGIKNIPFKIIHKYNDNVFKILFNGNLYILKLYNKIDYKRILFISCCQDYIYNSLGCTAEIIKTANEDNYLLYKNNSSIIIYKYIKGYQIKYVHNDLYGSIGLFIAKLHRYLSYYNEIKGNPYYLRYPSNNYEYIDELILNHEHFTGNIFYIKALKYKKDLLLNINKDNISKYYSIKKQIIHGDIYLGNIIYEYNGNNKYIIDFDQSSYFPRIYELCRAFFMIVNIKEKDKYLIDYLKYYLGGYCNEYGLSFKERKNIFEFYLWILLWDTYCFDININTSKIKFAQKRIDIIKFINRNIDNINTFI
jgi:Ser/Thr protein kinase RdoA (MazF antagonist)